MKTVSAQALAAFFRAGGKIKVGRTRYAKGHKTFGRKGPKTDLGAKQITIRDSLGFARR